MKRLAMISLFMCVPSLAAGDNAVLKFKDAKVGELPHSWKKAKTGKGTGGEWKIVEDKDATGGLALAQTKADKDALFNICVAEGTRYKDVDFTVSFKAMAGDRDQGGGPVWRFQDGNNYYVARMNPLEDNYRLYKVVAGKRIQLATKEDLKAPVKTWHTLTIKMIGDHIECSFDGKKYLDAKDDTLPKAGKVGLWTKADAQSYFDELKIMGK